MTFLRNLFSRWSSDTLSQMYWLGFREGREAEQRRILAETYKRELAFDRYPNIRDANVISISRHRSWQPPKGVA